MRLVDYEENDEGEVNVQGETRHLYAYLDYARLAEDLGRWTEETIRTELKNELDFIVSYRKAREGLEARVDLPDKSLNNFIRIVVQNRGRLSHAKRNLFAMLSDTQVRQLEGIVRAALGLSR